MYRDSVIGAVRAGNGTGSGANVAVSVEDCEKCLDYFSVLPDFSVGGRFFLADEVLPKSDDEPLSPVHFDDLNGRHTAPLVRNLDGHRPNYATAGSAAAEPDGWGDDDGWDERAGPST